MTSRPTKRRTRRAVAWRVMAVGGAAAVVVPLAGGTGIAAQNPATESTSGPIVAADPQQWTDQADMTWNDYVPVRPPEWNSAETSSGTENQYRTAVILLDFQDQPFVITQDAETHPFGNPQSGWQPVAPEDVNDWFYDYYAVPNEYNGGQTLHSYWMEDSHGRIGVDVEVFGPYTLPGKLHEYGIAQFNTPLSQYCPQGDTCNRNIRTDGGNAWRADIGCASGLCGFDNGFYVTAGHDESSTWEEFGQMLFADREDVPDELGPPRDENGDPPLNQNGDPMPNWANTRYVDWTSWKAAANHWPNAGGGTSTQAESSGQSVFAHEFSHLRGLPDNYNNPFSNTDRNYTGYWEMMSRGTFNGPGGTHNRWQIPNAGGSALGPHHMLHFKTAGSGRLGVVTEDEQVTVNRPDLVNQGVAVTTLQARSAIPNGHDVGLTVNLGAGGYTPGNCQTRVSDNFFCTHSTQTSWQRFTMEVVDRVGNDSFTPGHGVLLAQTRNSGTPRVWLVDANPENINRLDYFRPDGTPVPVVKGDPRQLDDATFHAGTGSDSLYEYVDPFNSLHFYVLDAYRNEDGVLFYDVAVRNLNGAGAFERDASLGGAATYPVGDSTALVAASLTNTGAAGAGVFDSDVYRLSASVDGEGWDVHLPYEVVAAAAGDSVPVSAYATAGEGATESVTVSVTATSETDASVSVTLEVEVTTADLKVTLDTASALVEAYYAGGVIAEDERNQLRSQLTVLRRTTGTAAQQAVDHFEAFAARIAEEGARNLASAALVSVAGDLRSNL
ncbi:MAG TPA: M6 family metalloprotease domain-containing protein [Jiangellaceae bacterium]